MTQSVASPPAERVAALRACVEAALAGVVPAAEPAELYEPIRYVLAGGGKRLRPVLLLLAAEACGASTERALPAALAVEVFHNSTLVHDDIMDAADERRGRAAVHVRWDESTAILVGDYLLALSFELLARLEAERPLRVVRTFHRAVARVCEGQTLDLAFERRDGVTLEAYLEMIAGKTAALLEAALAVGGLVAGAADDLVEALATAGREAGLAFQIRDDLLDLVAEDDRWGKTIGGDLIAGKRSFLLLTALERAEGDEHAWFARILADGGLPAGDVPEARRRMEALGVLDAAREAAERHSRRAAEALGRLPDNEAARTLRWLLDRLAARRH